MRRWTCCKTRCRVSRSCRSGARRSAWRRWRARSRADATGGIEVLGREPEARLRVVLRPVRGVRGIADVGVRAVLVDPPRVVDVRLRRAALELGQVAARAHEALRAEGDLPRLPLAVIRERIVVRDREVVA